MHGCGCDVSSGACVYVNIVQSRLLITLGVFAGVLCAARPFAVSPFSVYSRSIQALGGTPVDPGAFPETVAGFQQYLSASGVRAVSAVELTRPHHPDVASRLGFDAFLPPRNWWPRGAALALLTQGIRERARGPVAVRNWWRPARYNADPAVGGAKNGDHPTANALDLDYATVGSRMQAELYLRQLERKNPWMELSFGFGALSTHVGLASPRGHREWHYAGWQPPRQEVRRTGSPRG